MKNYQILELNEKMKKYASELKDLRGAKFSYAIIKNTAIISDEMKTISTLIESNDDYKSYESERVKMCEDFAKKDEEGNFIRKNQTNEGQYEYDIDLSDTAFLKAFEELKSKHSDTIKLYEEKANEYNKFLSEESIINLIKIKLEDIPNDISVELMSVISEFID